jgi:O-acetyl-ADP-ribose deacetylase (regulator of RNase III)
MRGKNDLRARLQEFTGDATAPICDGPKVIAHICNDVGRWGKGFVLALSKRWKTPEQEFYAWHRGERPALPPFELGRVQFVEVPPIRYGAVETALRDVASFAREKNAAVHMPRIGCGLAGGTWERIEPIVQATLVHAGVNVFVYEFPASK